MTVTTTLELRADEPLVRVRTRFTNPSRDHRLRVHLPLPSPATTSQAECAFTVVERGLTAEGRSRGVRAAHVPLAPVRAGRWTHRGPRGTARVRAGRRRRRADGSGPAAGTLALTLLRATGMLSRLGMSLRPLPAGPMDPLDGPQMLGPVDVPYALAVGDARPLRRWPTTCWSRSRCRASFGGGDRPDRGTELTVEGAEVSSVRREAGALEVRVFNPTDADTTVTAARAVRLAGRPPGPAGRPVRGLVRPTAPRDRHRPARRALTGRRPARRRTRPARAARRARGAPRRVVPTAWCGGCRPRARSRPA